VVETQLTHQGVGLSSSRRREKGTQVVSMHATNSLLTRYYEVESYVDVAQPQGPIEALRFHHASEAFVAHHKRGNATVSMRIAFC
jgi:hypothetical protein